MMRACDYCHKIDAPKMQFCGQCRMTAYCNAECQRSDWARHKVDCKYLGNVRVKLKTPLILAVLRENVADIRKLLHDGADVNKAVGDGETPLYTAALGGNLGVIQCLVDQGADANKALDDGRTPLYIAAEKGHVAVVQLLVQQGADKNKATDDGCTPIFIGAAAGHVAAVQYLVQQGADMNKADNAGATALLIAAQQGCLTGDSVWCDKGLTRTRFRTAVGVLYASQFRMVAWK
jgi:ankyrin repeat protein